MIRLSARSAILILPLLAACDRVVDVSGKSGSTVEVERGSFLSVTLGTSPTVSPEYQYSWEDAVVTGAAVKFDHYGKGESRAEPGSAGSKVYVFKAVDSGEADILIRRKAGAQAEPGRDYALRVRVK